MLNSSDEGETHLPMFVLDVLRWADSYDSILRVINDHHTLGWRDIWGRSFQPAEVDSALAELKRQGLVTERSDIPDYYEITPSGRVAWEEWIPPGEAGDRVLIGRLLKKWDPIGVFDQPDWPEDEYEGYVKPLVGALETGADVSAIGKLLQEFRDHMGLQPSPNSDSAAAEEILSVWASRHN